MSDDERSVVLYDEDCGFCRWSADRLRALDRRGELRFVPIQSPEGQRLLAVLSPERRLESWHLVRPDGTVRSSGAAVPEVLRRLPGGAPLASVASAAPGLTEHAYRFVAARRERWARMLGQDACRVDPSRDRRDSARS
jgi:predicted DCC family thiol-disulfide oxidoreductase YuxK